LGLGLGLGVGVGVRIRVGVRARGRRTLHGVHELEAVVGGGARRGLQRLA